MSNMDRAFIRAYADDVPPPEHTRQPATTQRNTNRQGALKAAPAVTAAAPLEPNATETPVQAAAPIAERQVPAPHARFNAAQDASREPFQEHYEMETTVSQTATSHRRAGAVVDRPASHTKPNRPAASENLMPLSAYTAPAKLEQRFRAGLEVDHFVWPALCGDLTTNSSYLFDSLAEELIDEAARGHKVVAISSCRRGEGRTSLMLCVARRLASSGVRVCMVDADIHNPQLGRRLGLAAQVGWDSVVSGELALTEVLVDSLDDRLTLLPLRNSAGFETGPSAQQFALMTSILRDHYDIVLIDTGPLLEGTQSGLHLIEENSGVEAAVLVTDLRSPAPEQMRQAQRLLAAAHIRCTGIAENFVQV